MVRFTCRYALQGCEVTFATQRGEQYHVHRYCKYLPAIKVATAEEDAGHSEEKNEYDSSRDGTSSESESFEEVNNWASPEFLRDSVVWPAMQDEEGNPSASGFYLFCQTIESARLAARGRLVCGGKDIVAESI